MWTQIFPSRCELPWPVNARIKKDLLVLYGDEDLWPFKKPSSTPQTATITKRDSLVLGRHSDTWQ